MTTDLLRDLIEAAHEEGMTYAVWTEHGGEYRSEHEAAERATATAQTALETAQASRTCANCKHWKVGEGEPMGVCDELFSGIDVEIVKEGCAYGCPVDVELSTLPDFGCNRFESKEN